MHKPTPGVFPHPAGARRAALPDVVRNWHVVLVAGCNLRCSYCATDFGRFGQAGGVMDLRTAKQLADRIAESMDPALPEVAVSFGGGETFLHFDRFIAVADLIVERCRQRGGRARLVVTTNGVLLDAARLRKLARRRIGLSFSIDGPAPVHDAARRDAAGRKTFRRASGNWSRYRALIRNLPDAPSCDINCVYGPHSGSLAELVAFWSAQDVPLLNIVAVNHSQFEPAAARRTTDRVRARFAQELHAWALAQTQRCSASDFLGRYRGPSVLFSGWLRLFSGQEKMTCTPGRGMLAAGHDGALYPCEAYVGQERRQVGDVFGGIARGRLDRFTAACAKAAAVCTACASRAACEKPCLALMASASPARNVRRACAFALRVATLTRDTFDQLMRTDAEAVR